MATTSVDAPRGGGAGAAGSLAGLRSLTEGALPEYGALGTVRQPAGGVIATASPSNAYRLADGIWVLIAANSDPLFRKLAGLMGRPELAADPRLANRAALDAEIGAWTAGRPAAELERMLEAADAPATRAYTAADCAADEQFRHRGMVREMEDAGLGPMLHPGIVPHIHQDPGAIRWAGPAVGARSEEVFGGPLGLSDAELAALRDKESADDHSRFSRNRRGGPARRLPADRALDTYRDEDRLPATLGGRRAAPH